LHFAIEFPVLQQFLNVKNAGMVSAGIFFTKMERDRVMKILNKFILAAGVSLATAAFAADYNVSVQTPPSPTPTVGAMGAQDFVSDAVWGGDKEVALGKLAQERSQNPDVKAFGQQMIRDHSRANQQLITIADREGLGYPATNVFYFGGASTTEGTTELSGGETKGLPSNPENENPKGLPAQAMALPPVTERNADIVVYRDLGALSGADFDKAYAAQMVNDHAEDIQKFENASAALNDPQLKQFATQTLTTIREHYRMAQDLQAKVGGTTSVPGSRPMTPPPSY
jgi:putative membrane protein